MSRNTFFSLSSAAVALFWITSEVHAFSAHNPTTIRICTGSNCVSKCRAGFNPIKSFENLKNENEDVNVQIEETFCMNQCKRGPNLRLLQNDQVLTFDGEGIMNDVEMKRKSFQSIGSDEKIGMLWNLIKDIQDGNVDAKESGAVEKLTDIMPAKK